MMLATLVFPVRDGNVLMSKKTRNIGEGKWNGYGGRIEEGELPPVAACREFQEEVGLSAQSLREMAVVDCLTLNADGGPFTCRIYVFLATSWAGTPIETAEMATPTWFAFDKLPLAEMMPADRVWLPRVLCGETLYVVARYGPGQKELIDEPVIWECSARP